MSDPTSKQSLVLEQLLRELPHALVLEPEQLLTLMVDKSGHTSEGPPLCLDHAQRGSRAGVPRFIRHQGTELFRFQNECVGQFLQQLLEYKGMLRCGVAHDGVLITG